MKQCDISKVEPLLELFKAPQPQRDAQWHEQFYAIVADASFRCETPQVFAGPDGFPYFSLLSPEPFKPFDSFCLSNLAEAATEKGFGVTINRRSDGADWVFSYGDMLALRLTGTLEPQSTGPGEPPKKITIEKEERVFSGTPSETYLPSCARSVIRQFMQRGLGIQEPKVLLLHRPKDPKPMQLVFSVFREQYQSDHQYFGVLHRLSWFLPRHYTITGVPMSSDLQKELVPL